MIIRSFVAPSKYNTEQKGTNWLAEVEEGKQLWVQTGDQDNPVWRRWGDIMEEQEIQLTLERE